MIVGVVGLGLIGGSIAKALKKHKACDFIIAYDNNTETLKNAKEENIINEYTLKINKSFAKCQVIFICTPVDSIFGIIEKFSKIVPTSCIITDVGSTKNSLAHQVNQLHPMVSYIGGHPMAGLEKNGYDYSSEILLENAYYLITKSSFNTEEQMALFQSLIKKIKAIPLIISPEYHDYIVASISHIPHIIASSLVNMVKSNDQDNNYMHTLASGGFRDITRIASSSPTIWKDICLHNSQEIQDNLKVFINKIKIFEEAIINKDEKTLLMLFTQSKEYRDSFDNRQTSIMNKIYDFSISVEDKPGIIADVSTILAKNNINIKNIGILNNRESYGGALRIELYSEEHRLQALQVLEKLQYNIHVKE
ncbi:MAG: prephenate dehydrogenase/arogenate dehydrogenase family protein [Clostridiales bacterium]|nr:prephenate dehydrogenase/arogenate dehydrogenase family protein [Clostridiales bacterium]